MKNLTQFRPIVDRSIKSIEVYFTRLRNSMKISFSPTLEGTRKLIAKPTIISLVNV